jgi:hypothetical protein
LREGKWVLLVAGVMQTGVDKVAAGAN